MKYQLPHHWGSQHESLCKGALEIYNKRNLIVHRNANFPWNSSNKAECDQILDLVEKLNTELDIEPPDYRYKSPRPIGIFLEQGRGGDIVSARFYSTRVESKFAELMNFNMTETLLKELFLTELTGYTVIPNQTFNKIMGFKKDGEVKIFIQTILEQEILVKNIKEYLECLELEITKVYLSIVFIIYPIESIQSLKTKLSSLTENSQFSFSTTIENPRLIIYGKIGKVIQFLRSSNKNRISKKEFLRWLKNNPDVLEPYFQKPNCIDLFFQNFLRRIKEDEIEYYSLTIEPQFIPNDI